LETAPEMIALRAHDLLWFMAVEAFDYYCSWLFYLYSQDVESIYTLDVVF
jgi:hypothetical protein